METRFIETVRTKIQCTYQSRHDGIVQQGMGTLVPVPHVFRIYCLSILPQLEALTLFRDPTTIFCQ